MITKEHNFRGNISRAILCLITVASTPGANAAHAAQAQQINRPLRIKTEISRIALLVNQTINRLRAEQPECTCAVIVLGKSSEGKSTLINCLAGKRARTRQIGDSFIVEVDEPLEGMMIHHDAASETKVPTYWYDQERRIAWFDCAGLGDSDDERDIINSYVLINFFRKMAEIAPQVGIKILLTTARSSLEGTAYFRESVDYVAKLFRENEELLQRLGRHICLAILKANNAATAAIIREHIRDRILQRLIETQQLDPNCHEARLMGGLIEHSPIVFFRKPPEQEGFFLEGEQGIAFRHSFFDAVNQIEPMLNPSPQLVLSAPARLLAQQAGGLFSENIAEPLDQITQLVVTSCKNKIDSATNSVVLRQWLRDRQALLNDINDETALINRLDALLTECNQPVDLCRQLRINLDAALFLDPGAERAALRRACWLQKLSILKNLFQKLSHPEHVLDNNRILLVKALFAGLGEIRELYEAHHHRIKTMRVFLAHTLLLDDNLTCPSVSCILIAPRWKATVNNCCIDLSGRNGLAVAQPAIPGAQGNPGNPGKHAGHFLAKGSSAYQLEFVTVKANGGHGSNGTNGCQGNQGAPGVDGNLNIGTPQQRMERVLYRDLENGPLKEYFKERLIEILANRGVGRDQALQIINRATAFSCDYTPIHHIAHGSPGANGAPGGRGAKGGAAGTPGNINLLSNELAFSSIQNIPGSSGRNGVPGAGGEGGLGGLNCQGNSWSNVKIYQQRHRRRDQLHLAPTVPGHADHSDQRATHGQAGATPANNDLINAPTEQIIQAINANNEEQLYSNYIQSEKEAWEQAGLNQEVRNTFIKDI